MSQLTATSRRVDPAPLVPGLTLAVAAAAVSTALHLLLPDVGQLTWALLLGVVATNLGLLPRWTAPGLAFAVRRLLRAGIVLLGLSLSLTTVAALGFGVVAVIVASVLATLSVGLWLGSRLGLGTARRIVVVVGCAICGASAIAAVQDPAGADEDDVAVSVAVITLLGSVAMLALPLLQGPLGLSDAQLGVWSGAGVHEVGQVVAAASPAGAAAVAVATVVKLCRVLCLAPVVAAVGVWQHRSRAGGATTQRPPLVPLFVIGFFGCVLLRTFGLVPGPALHPAALVQGWLLAAALFGLGTGVNIRSLVRGSGPALVLGLGATATVTLVSLAGVLMLG